MSQLDQATKLLDILRPLNCKLALDDFGAGFSSFAYLKRLNVDFVKVDGQFVVNICEDSADQAIVKSICQLGQDMGFDVVANLSNPRYWPKTASLRRRLCPRLRHQ